VALECRKRGGQEKICVLLAFTYCCPSPNKRSALGEGASRTISTYGARSASTYIKLGTVTRSATLLQFKGAGQLVLMAAKGLQRFKFLKRETGLTVS